MSDLLIFNGKTYDLNKEKKEWYIQWAVEYADALFALVRARVRGEHAMPAMFEHMRNMVSIARAA
jgi:hypothetical protein